MFQDPLIRILLLPLSLLYGLGISLRDLLYRQKLLIGVRFDIPVISIGNLSIGGAGKTPHTEYLIRLLSPYLEVATLSRGYRRKTQGHQAVHVWNNAEQVGDEPLMFKRKFPGVHVAVNENRALGIPQMIQEAPQTQVVLLDDAFQHRSVLPGLNILLTEYSQPFTKDFLLPSGRLREWRSAYRRADLIIVTKCPQDLTTRERLSMEAQIHPFPHQKVFFSSYRYLQPWYILNPNYRLELQEDMAVLAFCAIANINYLKSYLESKTATVRLREFEDHHYFSQEDLEEIERIFKTLPGNKKLILTTEKDAIRLEPYKQQILEKQLPLVVLPIEVYFHDRDGEQFDKLVKEFLLNFKA